MTALRVLVAGVGNVFLGDDGFGVEVVRRVADDPLPEGVKVADFGIRGLHLAYELLEGWDTAILVDASPRGDEPGTLYLLEVDPADRPSPPTPDEVVERGAAFDTHGMTPVEVLGLVDILGGTPPDRLLVLGCEPAVVDERMGLSEPILGAVDLAVAELRRLIDEESGDRPAVGSREEVNR